MTNRTASKWFAAIVATLSLTMVTSVTTADAAPQDRKVQLRDSGWDRP